MPDVTNPLFFSDLEQTYDPTDHFEFRPLRSPTAIPALSPANLAVPSSPASLLPVPLDGLPVSSTPWEPGRNAPVPLAPPSPQFYGQDAQGSAHSPVNNVGGIGSPWGAGSANASVNTLVHNTLVNHTLVNNGSLGNGRPLIVVIPDAGMIPPEVQAWLGQYLQGAAPSPGSVYLPNVIPNNLPNVIPNNGLSQTVPIPVQVQSPPPQSPTIPAIPFPTAPSVPVQSNRNTLVPLSAPPPSELAPRRSPVTDPALTLQGGLVLLEDEFSGRARVSGFYPVSPEIALAGAVEVSEGTAFSDSELEGANINELHLTFAPRDVPNLRLRVGHLDLTSYFDRNSFAKDALTHFFSPELQTNPALAANGLGSRTGALINYSITDDLEARAVLFSSDRSISDFDLTGFAGELGFRVGNAIIRGTYVSAIDGGANDGPDEIFAFVRDDGTVGIDEGDREESFGVNAEVFIPDINMGLFGRYGRYENQDADVTGDTFSGGFNFLDVISRGDRLGLGYGRSLSNDDLRDDRGNDLTDVWELFYDFRLSPDIRLGFTVQQLNEFTETIAGVRLKTEFDVSPSP
ncbi:MAG: porin [Cyanothece sp. SIO2G6]|nr:porin [Cyanothece sp. SIO2G6]